MLNDDAADTNGLVVTNISHTNGNTDTIESGSTYTDSGGEPGSVVGTYGTLKIGADGTYTYTADQAAADALDLNDQVSDVFTYTADGATATLTITVTGINDAPVAQNDVGVIVEDGTLPVANGANANVSGSYDATGEHSGDVIDTSSSSHTDSDADASASLTVTAIRVGSSEGSGTAGSIGSALTGTYGQLTIAADGSYSYVANQDAADALDAGDIVTDSFNYTVSDGTATDTAVITITVIGVNDAPVAQNDVGVIVEDGTLPVANGANANVSGSYDATGEHSGDVIDTSSSSHTDSDADASASLTVTAIRVGSSEGSGTAGSIGSALTGTYGQLTIAADGSYSYVANQDLADALDVGDTVTDAFNYTLSDGTATDIGVITITILGANDDPTAVNDTGYIKEGGTLTVANSAAASSGTSTGNHTGDMTDNDTDDDASSTATITSITATTAEGNAQTTFSSNSETVTGAYGTLTINSEWVLLLCCKLKYIRP